MHKLNYQLRNAAIRCGLALVLVIVWVGWYDGPPWAWAILLVYIGATVGMAFFIERKIQAAKDRAKKDDTS